MRKSRILLLGIVSTFAIGTIVGMADAAAAPAGVCAPPGAWTQRTDFPGTIVRSWGTYFPPTGLFYAIGGRADDTAGSDYTQINIYDPAMDSWSVSTATFEDNQVNNMVGGVLDVGGTMSIVIVGGSAAGAATATSDVRVYDPVMDSLTVLTTDPWPGNTDGAILPGGAAVYENKLFVFGGFDIGIGMTDAIWQFDPAAADGSRWTQMTATLPTPVGYVPVATSGSMIYTFGGSGFDGTTLFDNTDSFAYDPDADSITSISPIPRAVGETRAVTQPDGSIWVLGGGRVAPNPSNEVDVYDPVMDTWSLGLGMITARRNLAADVDPASGAVWATGGYDTDGTTPLAANEEFVPCDDTIFADGFDGP